MLLKRLSTACGILSGVLLITLVVSSGLDPTGHVIAFTPTFHIGMFDGQFCVYRNDWPYNGSVIQLDGEPPIVDQSVLDFPGVYFRHFEFAHTFDTIWTLKVSLWYPVLAFASVPLLLRKFTSIRRVDSTEI